MVPSKWPKTFPPLTAEQERIRDDFVKHWMESYPKRYGALDRFGHRYCVRNLPSSFQTTLEIGAGVGEHLEYETLTPEQESNYHALELRESMSQEIRRRFPRIQTLTGDCQQPLPFADSSIDRVLAIHVLEHLPNLPATIREVHRVCHKDRGIFSVVIPCEGCLAYTTARRFSSARIFAKRYNQSYQWFIEREHINMPWEIIELLRPYFRVSHRSFYPLRIPAMFCNLFIGLTLIPRKQPLCDPSEPALTALRLTLAGSTRDGSPSLAPRGSNDPGNCAPASEPSLVP